jgi:hypothetical protein
MDPILVARDPRCPYFVDPTDARPALPLPPLDRVQREKVGPVLAKGDEQVIVPFEPDRSEARVQDRQRLRKIHPNELLLHAIAERKARPGLRTDKVDIVDLGQHVLGFVDGALEDDFPELPQGRHTDPWRSLRLHDLVIPGPSTLTSPRRHFQRIHYRAGLL